MSESNQSLAREFYSRFQAARFELVSRIDAVNISGLASDTIEQLSVDVAKLRKELTDATSFLPSYDQRQCEDRLKEIEESLERLRTASVAKPKFAFRRKTEKKNPPAAISSPTGDQPSSAPRSLSDAQSTRYNDPLSNSLILSGHSHKCLDMASLSIPPSLTSSDLTISDLDHCVLNLIPVDGDDAPADISFKITALHIRNIQNSVLVLPKIQGSALLHDLSRCVVVLGCHQFRMHTSSRTDVYLSVSSNPIIEHCSEIRFTSFPQRLVRENGSTQIIQSSTGLLVQDFSHIRSTPSPNWSILSDDQVIPDKGWDQVHKTNSGDVDGILHKLLPSA